MKFATITSAAVILTLMGPGNTHEVEQDDVIARLLACDDMPVAADRVSCFDGLADSVRRVSRQDTTATPAVEGGPPEVEAEPPEMPAAASRAKPVQPTRQPDPQTPAVGNDDFGRDSMKVQRRSDRADKADVRIEAVIVDVRIHHDQHFSVELDNGQVWRETSGNPVRHPRVGSPVEIWKGNLGGYRMKIDGNPRLAWVRRTR